MHKTIVQKVLAEAEAGVIEKNKNSSYQAKPTFHSAPNRHGSTNKITFPLDIQT